MAIIKHTPLLLLILSFSANADVFKCKLASGKIIYQSTPCPTKNATQDIVKIEDMAPQKAEEAKRKLKAWQEQHAIEEAEEIEAKKQRQLELDRQESLELQRRSAIAQEQQAIAAQQPKQDSPVFYVAPGFNQRYWGNTPELPDRSHNNNLPNQRFFSPMLTPPLLPYPATKAPERHQDQSSDRPTQPAGRLQRH